MELAVYKITGDKTTKKVELSDSIFAIEPNDNAIYMDVKQFMANNRQGTHSTKERNAVAGSRRKIKRQKGTGTARAGDIKSPIFRGGGRAFGPHPRDYNFKLNKKLKKIARKSALTYKAKDNNIFILEDFDFDSPKTKNYIEFLNNFNLADSKTLLILTETKENIYLSSRNIKKTKITKASSINTYDILNANSLLIPESSLKEIEELFA
ncbi:MAG: 50S ribosomal protein L4 [Bacteroidetes bacterium]|nr:50S ribosomal protein L4 [Bacteroidota bacterium]MCK4360921.1 50S ribosomal protein L4 [Bacteroidales bacterium]MCK4407602.1 50S ribosomal protein L4 [Bacteroidales bacterium]